MDIRRYSFRKTQPTRMNLEDELFSIMDAIMSQYDNYCFFVGRDYLDELENNTEYMGYDIVFSPLVAHDEVLFAPINTFYINTNN